MRCLLINPFCPITEGPTPPLGLSFLAAVMERAGLETRILDLSVFPFSSQLLDEYLRGFKPEIVGITAVTMTFNNAMRTIRAVKEVNPEIVTVMGGPHVSFCAQETLSQNQALDFIVIGEGEETMVELVAEISGEGNWSKIKGLAYRDGASVKINGKRDFLDVNSLPLPARHLLPLGRYRALHTPISITTSRGCPFRCIFCVGRQMVGANVRYRDPLSVVDELELLAEFDFPQINISDDLFTAKTSHCIAICDEILKRNLSITWSSFSRVDTISMELLRKMKEAGCKTISFGVETANKEILKTIKKGITLEKVERAVSMCTDVGIQSHVSFILGLPGETPESLQETKDFGCTIDKLGGFYGFHLLAPFPGTAVRDHNADYDLKILTDDWDQYHANRAIVETSKVTQDDLNQIADEWETATHAELQRIRERISAGTASEEESWQLINLDRFLFVYQLMMDRVIEDFGSWYEGPSNLTSEQALRKLAERTHHMMKQPLDKAYDLYVYIYQRRGIFFRQEEGKINWEWKNYL